ncbi:MAG: TolC family protein, partial [Bacteroidia bacterium]
MLHLHAVKFNTVIFFILLFSGLRLSAQLNFTSIDSVLSYAAKNSSSLKINSQQDLLAKWTKIAALGSSVNLRSPFTFSSTDNSMLPVNFIPAEIFGGPAGTFRPITLGQRYVSNFNFNPQIDIINPYAWAKVKSASVNKELTAVNDLLNKRSLFESIAAAYHNAAALSEQIAVTERHLAAADSLLIISQNKFSQGITREQDVNNMKVNQLGIGDKLVQLKVMLNQQYNSLKILCDIPSSVQVSVTEPVSEPKSSVSKVSSDLNYR